MIKNYKEKIDDRYYIVIEDGIEYCVLSPPNSESEWWAKIFMIIKTINIIELKVPL